MKEDDYDEAIRVFLILGIQERFRSSEVSAWIVWIAFSRPVSEPRTWAGEASPWPDSEDGSSSDKAHTNLINQLLWESLETRIAQPCLVNCCISILSVGVWRCLVGVGKGSSRMFVISWRGVRPEQGLVAVQLCPHQSFTVHAFMKREGTLCREALSDKVRVLLGSWRFEAVFSTLNVGEMGR